METLHQGASAALMLAGLAVLLLGIAALVWAIGRLRAEQGQLELEQASAERAKARMQAHAEGNRQRIELVQALLPAATTALGHWLGSQSGRHAREDLPPPLVSHCCGPMPPRGSFFPEPDGLDDDETQVELDLGSLFESISESGFGDWLRTVMQQAKASPSTPPTTTTEPGPETASAASAASV